MSHDTDPKPVPPDPNDRDPQAGEPKHGPGPDDELNVDFTDLADISFAELSDVESTEPAADVEEALPIADAEDLPAEGAIGFDLPPQLDEDHGNRTVGVAFADLPDTPDLSGDLKGHLEGEPLPPVPHEPLHVETIPVGPVDEVAEVIPPAEMVDESGILDLAEAVPDDLPMADVVSGTDLPAAEVVEPEPPPAADVQWEAVAPVLPASGWITAGTEPPAAEPISGSGAGLGEVVPILEGSDIFAGDPVPGGLPTDQSDVIAATAYSPRFPSTPVEPIAGLVPTSDVALSFNEPPGGSTTKDPAASAELPVAEETASSSELLSAEEVTEPLDSARLAEMPDLPTDPQLEVDFGSAPPPFSDASSILAEFISPPPGSPGDSSAIRLEAPGVERTLTSDSGGSEFAHDATLPDTELPLPPAEQTPGSSESTDWQEPAGSDLFTDARTLTEIELGDADVVDAFAGQQPVDQGSLTSEQSSIFSGTKSPSAEAEGSGSDDVQLSTAEVDSVDFSDHPDPRGADSDSLHRPLPAGAENAEEFDVSFESDDVETIPLADDAAARWGVIDNLSTSLHHPTTEDSANDLLKAAGLAPASGSALHTPAPSEEHPSEPAVVVNWVAESSAEIEPVNEELVTTTPARNKDRRELLAEPATEPRTARAGKPRQQSGSGKLVAGGLFGLLAGAGVCAGLYYAEVIPGVGPSKPVAQTPVQPLTQNGGGPATPGTPDGTPPVNPDTPEGKAVRGRDQLNQLVRAHAAEDNWVPNAAALKPIRADLEAAANDPAAPPAAAIRATIELGITHELARDWTGARQVYTAAKRKFPTHARVFDANLRRVNRVSADAGRTSRLTPTDARHLLLATAFLVNGEAPAPAAAEPTEAGLAFWEAVDAAATRDYTTAAAKITEAKKAHEKRARALAGRGLNPLSDPLEQIFPRCCDDLKAYWGLRATLKDYPDAGALVKAANSVKTVTAERDAARTELAAEKDKVATLGKDLKDAENLSLDLKDKLKKAGDALAVSEMALAVSDKARTAAETTLTATTAELQALKKAPNLSNLVPNGIAAVGGSGLSAGQLLDLAQRLSKADTAVKAARTEADRATADLKKLKDEQAAELKKVTDLAAKDLKDLADKHKTELAAELKKAADANAVSVDTLKKEQAAELKKVADTFASDKAKLEAEQAKAVAALKDQITREEAKAAAVAKQHAAELGEAVSPAQTLDLWLPILAELRRPADADPALAVAAKVLKTAAPGSETEAKAATVAGIAYLLKKDAIQARAQFVRARNTAAYAAADGKDWTKAVELGLAVADDPVAAFRRPVGPRTDPATAARFLDAGITAYKAGRFAVASAALLEATKNDPTDPLSWYFLGATRWAQKNTKQAEDDFAQGAERERSQSVSARVITSALTPIQGAARDALNRARP